MGDDQNEKPATEARMPSIDELLGVDMFGIQRIIQNRPYKKKRSCDG